MLRARPRFVLCLASALVATLPLWMFRYVPLQDLPVHLGTLRVLHDYQNPVFGFSDVYAVGLGKTQYALFYILGHLLAFVVGVPAAGLVLASAYMAGTVMALYALLDGLKKDPRLCLFAIPFLVNNLLILGLLPFLISIPLMLAAWAVALRYRERPRLVEGGFLALVLLALFYAHIIPFAIGVLGVALIAPLTSRRALLVHLAPLAPALIALLFWLLFTESGSVVWRVATVKQSEPWPIDWSLREIYSLAFDVYRDGSDERYAICTGVLAALFLAFATKNKRAPGDESVSGRFLFLLPIACLVLYFRADGESGYAAHIRDRFPVLAVLTSVPLLRLPEGWKGHLATSFLLVVCGLSIESTYWHFSRFCYQEVGDFPDALAAIPPNKRVAGIIFDSTSAYVQDFPFLHFVNYYQVEKGGVVKYSFTGFPHWVTSFRPHHDPLGLSPARNGWEFQPTRVSARDELAPYYDYVLTRGNGFDPPDDLYKKKWQGTGWSVWERR